MVIKSAKFAKGRLEELFGAAWRKVDDSFADDQDAVLDGIREAFLRNIEHVTPTNLSATVVLFKKLGQTGRNAQKPWHAVHNATGSGRRRAQLAPVSRTSNLNRSFYPPISGSG